MVVLVQRVLRGNPTLFFVYVILGVFLAFAAFTSPQFRTVYNISNFLRQAVSFGIVGVGQTVAILSGGIDLSVGSLISLVACLTSGIMIGNPTLVIPIVLFVLGIGILVGLANGTLVAYLRVPPFIATLAMSAILQGSVLLYTKKPVGGVTRGFMFFANGQLGPAPFAFIFWAILLVFFLFILRRTGLGLHVYAVGGNEEIARLSGIRVPVVKVAVYVISGFMAALTGLFLASRLGIGDPLVGQGFELESITAVLIGGTSLAGGKGGIEGTIAGVLIIALINNILNLLGVSGFWQWVIKGVVVIAVVAAYKGRE
ncbi:MAG: ABC transporter permease [Candidatus Caldatribacteriaceae bacterium]